MKALFLAFLWRGGSCSSTLPRSLNVCLALVNLCLLGLFFVSGYYNKHLQAQTLAPVVVFTAIVHGTFEAEPH